MSGVDRDRSEALVSNERVKALSSIFFNLGAALIAAAVTRSYVSQDIDRTALLWSVGAITTIWVGWRLLYLLQAEESR